MLFIRKEDKTSVKAELLNKAKKVLIYRAVSQKTNAPLPSENNSNTAK